MMNKVLNIVICEKKKMKPKDDESQQSESKINSSLSPHKDWQMTLIYVCA